MAGNASSRKALLVIDMLNDFVLPRAPLRVPSAEGIIPVLKRRITEARSEHGAVIYLCDAHDPNDREFQDWPPHAVEGTPGAEVIDALAPAPGDPLIKKKFFSGFYGSRLEGILKEMAIDHLMVTGVVTNICVLYTVADARARGYRVTVFADSVAGLDPADHAFALKQMKEVLGAEVI